MVDIICFIYLFLEMILHISLFEHNTMANSSMFVT